MPHLDLDGLGYSFEVTGSGRLPPLLLLHGFTGSGASWDDLLPRLSADRLVLTVDLPGHGQTPPPAAPERAGMPAVSSDLAGLVSALSLDRFGPLDVLGYSMGGRLALFFALDHPVLVRRLVLESASPGLADPEERRTRQLSDEALAWRIEEHGIPAFVDEWEDLPLFASQRRLPEPARASLRQSRLSNTDAGLAASLRSMGTGVQPSLWPLLPGLHSPVLLLVGELDPKFLEINRRMQAAIPTSALHIIPDAGHTPHLENPAHYLEVVNEFLG